LKGRYLKKMGETKENMEQIYAQTFRAIREGDFVEGTVLHISRSDVIVDINYKSEARIPASEITNISAIKVGDKICSIVEDVEGEDGMVVLSKKKADRLVGWENILKNYKEGDLIEGKIIKEIRGGLAVDIGMEAFLPASQILTHPKQKITEFERKTFKFKIMRINKIRKNITLSRKEAILAEKEDNRMKILQDVQPGQIKKGVVRNIADFGAFVDIGGIDGLVYLTDIKWGRIKHPSEFLSVGKEVNVMVLNVDKAKQKISLGIKQLIPSPWESVEEKYPVGSRVEGKVVKVVQYGIFVELEDGIEALTHISEFSWTKKVEHPQNMFAIGDTVSAVVLAIDRLNQRISLGIKQLMPNPWENIEKKFPVGSQVQGVISAFSEQGAIVEMEDGINGMIHNSDISWTRYINHPSEVLKKGESVRVVVMALDVDSQKISLGLKQLQPDPWSDIVAKYTVGKIVEGTICKVTNFGLFIELEANPASPVCSVEGLVHISELNLPENKKIEDMFKQGARVTVKVIKMDGKQRKMGLSIVQG
jgi:small subunit ribosomal protein S1